jgi:hypothetical protein
MCNLTTSLLLYVNSAFKSVPINLMCQCSVFMALNCSLNAMVAQPKNHPFGVNTTIELKNIETTSHKKGIWQVMLQLRSVPVLSDVVVTVFDS